MVGQAPQRLAAGALGLREITGGEQQVAEVQVAGQVFRMPAHQLARVLGGVVRPVHPGQQHRAVLQRPGVAGVQRQGLVVGGQRRARVARLLQGQTEVDPHVGMLRGEGGEFPPGGQRLGAASQRVQHAGARRAGGHVARLQRHARLEGGQRLVEPRESVQRGAAEEVRARVVGLGGAHRVHVSQHACRVGGEQPGGALDGCRGVAAGGAAVRRRHGGDRVSPGRPSGRGPRASGR